jgi:hypothetical protein
MLARRLQEVCLLLCLASSALAQIAPEAAPEVAPSAVSTPCVDTAPDCEVVCNQEPGDVEDACSLQTPIGDYLR